MPVTAEADILERQAKDEGGGQVQVSSRKLEQGVAGLTTLMRSLHVTLGAHVASNSKTQFIIPHEEEQTKQEQQNDSQQLLGSQGGLGTYLED